MIYKQVLEQLGFSAKEISVYVSLLELDSAIVTEIANKAGINRTSCYDILSSLLKKGLVSKFIKKGKTYFSTGDPRRLLNYLDRERDEMEKSINTKKKMVEEVMSELMSAMQPKSTKPKVSFYEGDKGMREAYEDTLTSQNTILAYANVEEVNKGIPNFFPEYYIRRAKANIPIKAIFVNNPTGLERAVLDKKELRESIILEDKNKIFTPEVNIYNDKVLIASWKEKMAVIIESKELADLQRLIYKMLWEALKKDPKNIVL